MGTFAVEVIDLDLSVGVAQDAKPIFRDLNFTIATGEILSIIGASGSGKSTLLNLLTGFLKPDSGELKIHFDESQIGIVLQESNLFPWLNVRQNIEFGYRFARNEHSVENVKLHVDELLEKLGLLDLESKSIDTLSGGQAQRVAIARTLATKPKLLLLDEPFSSVDALTRHDLQDWVHSLRTEFDLTVILVTHDLDEAFYVGDRVGLIDQRSLTIQFFDAETVERKKSLDTELHNQIFSTLVRK
jgi:ABC-type nitrate/sulfonate/bicarbonate transport system ATPase subunit